MRVVTPGNSRAYEQALEQTREALPLDGLALGRNHVTGELEYVAPEGQTFQITGEFTVSSDQSDIADWLKPSDSLATLKKLHPAEYDESLARAGGDEAQAIEHLRDILDFESWEEDPPVSFSGRQLAINILVNGDQYQPEVLVKQDIRGWTEPGIASVRLPLKSGAQIEETYYFDVPNAITSWRRLYAAANLSLEAAQVTLITDDRPKPRLETKSVERQTGDLWVPCIPSAGEFVERLAKMLGETWTEEQKRVWVEEEIKKDRQAKGTGWAIGYVEDSLRQFAVIRSSCALETVVEELIAGPTAKSAQEDDDIPF